MLAFETFNVDDPGCVGLMSTATRKPFNSSLAAREKPSPLSDEGQHTLEQRRLLLYINGVKRGAIRHVHATVGDRWRAVD